MSSAKELRYYVMLALYFPILLYSVDTFDLSDETYAVKEYEAISVGEPTVVMGQEFEARSFLAAQELAEAGGDPDEGIRPELVPRGDLSAHGDSLLAMDTDDLLQPGEDERTISYEAYYQARQLGGATQRFPIEGDFTVRRPEIVANTETTQALYRQTRNRVRLSVPGLEHRSLRIEAPGVSTSGQTVEMSPTGNEVNVDVYLERDGDEDVYLGQREFAVVDPPRPQVRVHTPQGEVTSGDPLPKSRAMLEFDIDPDEEFASRYPEDARYEAEEVSVYLRQGMTASHEIGVFDLQDDGSLVLTEALNNAEVGDQVTVRVEGIYRVNHRGERIEVPLRENSRTFGFVVS